MKSLVATAFALALSLPGLAQADAADEAIYFANERTLKAGLGLKDVSLHKKGYGREVVRGILPEGNLLEFHLKTDGTLTEIDSLSTFGFNPVSVGRVLPPALFAELALPRGSRVRNIDLHHRNRVVIEGWDSQARPFTAKFTRDGEFLGLVYKE